MDWDWAIQKVRVSIALSYDFVCFMRSTGDLTIPYEPHSPLFWMPLQTTYTNRSYYHLSLSS